MRDRKPARRKRTGENRRTRRNGDGRPSLRKPRGVGERRRPQEAAPAPAGSAPLAEAPEPAPFPIVGIGASAGGLEALEQFLRNVPERSDMAFVVVQHLDPTHKAILVELLQRSCKMPVVEVKDRMKVEPGRVHVIPPNRDISILRGVLHLFPLKKARGAAHRLLLPVAGGGSRRAWHRRGALGDGLGRYARAGSDKGEGRGHLRAVPLLGQVHRDARQRRRRRARRHRGPRRGAAGPDHRLSPACQRDAAREGGARAEAARRAGEGVHPAARQHRQRFLPVQAQHHLPPHRAADGAALREEGRHKDEFLATLSHELRNPLGPIRNGLYLLEHLPAGSDQARRALAVIGRQLGHLTRIVEDLLDVTRIARGKVQLIRGPLDLAELVRRTLEDHRSGFEARGIALLSAIERDVLWVDGDPTRLVQVLGNLLGNAQEFTGRGGQVQVSLQRDRELAALSVSDTGVGLEPEVRAHLFEPFSQGRQPLDRGRGGLGLGLAMVKGLVELHGGTVAASSDGPGSGTRFTVKLPVVAAPRRARAGDAPRRAARLRVLVIEDNEDAASSLKQVLELSGHEVEVALDGPSGLALARAHRPEIIICDIGLPGMNGYEVARALRADPASRSAFLIALTGYARPDDARRAAEAGFDRHMGKPPPLEKLEVMLAEIPAHTPPPAG